MPTLPFKLNQDRRRHIPEQKRRVTNWREYDESLRRRGSLTVWFSDEAVEAWEAERRTSRGGQPEYSDLAILTALTFKAVFRLAYRQTEGLIGSVIGLLGLDLAVPDHTTLCRRAETLEVPRPKPRGDGAGGGAGGDTGPMHLLVDSTGLKLYGAGEWLVEKHGAKRRRSWRKLHLGMDAETGRIVAATLTDRDEDDAAQVGPLLDQVADPVASVTADGAYDQESVYADVGPWCMDQGCGRNDPYPVLGSCDAGGLRASQLQHAVQDLDRHVHLSRPTLIRTRAQPVPDHALEPADGGLGPGARVVARGLLPAHSALLGDELQVAVPPRRRGLGRGAGHGGRARRNDDDRLGMALGHVGVNALLVVRAVRREGGDRVRDWVQQGADLGGVVFVAVGQGGGHDPAGLGVHAEMELPPRPAPLGAVLLDQPRARAVELQPRAVDQQVHGAGIAASAAIRTVAARLRPRHLQRLGPAAQGGVVRHGEVEPEQADDGADQPFGLAVRQPEHGLERQRRQDRQVGILGLPAPARAPLGLPRLVRLVRKPDRHAAAPAQALVVIAPVRDLALLLRDVVASVLVQLEGQGGHPGSDGGLPCYLDRAPGATRGIPATT